MSCPCRPGFLYASKDSLNQHRRSAKHKLWESSEDIRDVRARSKDFENENHRLKIKTTSLEMRISELVSEINQLKEKLQKKKGLFGRIKFGSN